VHFVLVGYSYGSSSGHAHKRDRGTWGQVVLGTIDILSGD
jgi:hypothetical protein